MDSASSGCSGMGGCATVSSSSTSLLWTVSTMGAQQLPIQRGSSPRCVWTAANGVSERVITGAVRNVAALAGEEMSGFSDFSNLKITERNLFLLIWVEVGIIQRDIGSSSRRGIHFRTTCSPCDIGCQKTTVALGC
jgi:hypothetical protein